MTVEAVAAAVEIAQNPIARLDPSLAREFEETVVRALGEPADALVIRFGVWDGEDDGPRFVCRIEEAPRRALGSSATWRWWSPMVRTSGELFALVREAVQARARQAASRAIETPALEYWGWGSVRQAGA